MTLYPESSLGLPGEPHERWHLFVLSGADRADLEARTDCLAADLASRDDWDLDALETVLYEQARRPLQRVVLGRGRGDTVASLRDRDPERVFTEMRHIDRAGSIVFMFPGGGAQYPDMGRGLFETSPRFRAAIESADRHLARHLGFSVLSSLYPSPDSRADATRQLATPLHALPALFAVEYALAQLWKSLGVKPAAMIGHSLGEYVAACLSGVLSLADAAFLVATRAQLVNSVPRGAMVTVPLPADEARRFLGSELSLAVIAGPRTCVISGRESDVQALAERLRAGGIEARQVPIVAAGHSQLMDPILDAFRRASDSISVGNIGIPYISNVTGTWIHPQDLERGDYWVRHLRETVRLADGFSTMLGNAPSAVLEVGPGRTMAGLVAAQDIGTRPPVLLSLPPARDGQPDSVVFCTSVARLWLTGARIRWTPKRRGLPLPPLTEPSAEMIARHANPDLARSRPTDTERRLADIWNELLGVEVPSPGANFFDLGGHSLMASRVAARVRDTWGVDVTLADLLAAPTLARLAERIDSKRTGGAAAEPPLVPLASRQAAPLSFGQERLWFLEQLQPGNIFYNVYMTLEVSGALDVATLEAALDGLRERHEILRTTYRQAASGPVQTIAAHERAALRVEDFSHVGRAQAMSEIERLIRTESERPFDLTRGPVFRTLLFRLARTEHILLIGLHHLACDRWSLSILVRDLGALYDSLASGRPHSLPPLLVQYADFAAWERRRADTPAFQHSLSYWQAQLADAPVTAVAADHPRRPWRATNGARHALVIPDRLAADLLRLSKQEGVTIFMTLLATLSGLIARYTGQRDLVIGTIVGARSNVLTEHLIGLFVNTLLLRMRLPADPTFRELLRTAREVTAAAYEHQDLPFERLVEALQPERDLTRAPMFHVLLNLQNVPMADPHLGGLTARLADVERRSAMTDLHVLLRQRGDRLSGVIEYNVDLFEPDTIARLANHFVALLDAVVSDPAQRLWQTTILTPAERSALVSSPARPTSSLASRSCLHELFSQRAARTPNAVAVTYGAESLTYADLENASMALAERLAARGVGPEVCVGLCLERSPLLLVGILAILKAGGAYVPIAEDYPRDRVSFILGDARVRLILTQRSLAPRLEAHALPLLFADERTEAPREGRAAARVLADNLAYVIYTSGSTGNPKGVMVTHANVIRLFDVTASELELTDRDTWALFFSEAFDFSVWEMFGALLYGGRLVIVPYRTARDPFALARLVRDERITVLNQTPSAFRQLAPAIDALPGGHDLPLRLVIFGGEALDPAALKPWCERHGDERPQLVNMYGITETTVHVTRRVMCLADVARGTSPIGEPIPDLTGYVVDEHLNLVPFGVPGELCVGGPGLARGYINRPDLTAERFIPDPFSSAGGARLYRSGDRVRRLSDRDLEYHGRFDDQVKVRGYRIELGEIEAAIGSHPAVRQAAAIVRQVSADDVRLTTYVTLNSDVSVAELTSFARAKLPSYMVPSTIVVRLKMPLTRNGKVDRAVLKQLSDRPEPMASSPSALRSDLERVIAEVWCEALNLERAGPDDNFFDLGGHSLLLVRVHGLLREKLGRDFPLTDMFEAPTIRLLATSLSREDTRALPFAEIGARARKQKRIPKGANV